MMTKRCPACGEVKDGDEFAIDQSKASGRKSLCKACDRAKAARYYGEHREERAAYDAAHPPTNEQNARWKRDHRRRVRARAIAVYGGKCVWCGTTENLEFDHVGDDGKWHRQMAPEGQWLQRIATTGKPLVCWRLRLLCSSCHRGPGWREARAARDGTPIG